MSSKRKNPLYDKEWLENLTDDDFPIVIGENFVSEKCENCRSKVKYSPCNGIKRPIFCPMCGAPFNQP